MRGVRPIERALEKRTDEEAEAIRGYCLAVRSALTDDGRPPLDADGLQIKKRLRDISDSIARVAQKRKLPDELSRLQQLVQAGLTATEPLRPAIKQAYAWVHQAAHPLANTDQHDVGTLKQKYQHLLSTMAQQQDQLGTLAPAVEHFQKVTTSYWDGLFQCYRVNDLPRTNNDLEQFFGTARHTEQRCTGRKRASPTLVVRSSVRVVAAAPAVSSPFRQWISAPLMCLLGGHFAKPWTIDRRAVVANSASVVIRRPISPRWKSVFADQVCRRSFFRCKGVN